MSEAAPDDREPTIQKDIFWHLTWLRDRLPLADRDENIRFLDFCRTHFTHSKAQAFQDLFVLYELGQQRDGFFVEFGATDGLAMSNTWLLEKHYGWTGILAEPAHIWQTALHANRSCRIDTRCVHARSGERMGFTEVGTGEISTLSAYTASDGLAEHRTAGREYEVETVSLMDLLAHHHAPKRIDYLSLDTEGSEFDILCAFDFDAYDVRAVTVEHNFVETSRSRLFDLLTRNGFRRKFERFSAFDDWYVR
jgi:FkbM family methyltransferase